MIVDLHLLNAVGITRTHNTVADNQRFLEALKNPAMLEEVLRVQQQLSYPFYRFFSNYGTGIGETIEEVVAKKFSNIFPKKEGKKKNPIYEDYNKNTGKKPSNYDFLALINGSIRSGEVKVIRSADSKPKQNDKIHELPSLLEERALPYAERSKSGNQTFQQTKPDMFDYLLGAVIYADQVDFYLVPSDDIKSGKLKITNQHAGAINDDGSTDEGHLAVGLLDSYKFLTVKTEDELLATDDLNKYIK
jgi:hypothetical protein